MNSGFLPSQKLKLSAMLDAIFARPQQVHGSSVGHDPQTISSPVLLHSSSDLSFVYADVADSQSTIASGDADFDGVIDANFDDLDAETDARFDSNYWTSNLSDADDANDDDDVDVDVDVDHLDSDSSPALNHLFRGCPNPRDPRLQQASSGVDFRHSSLPYVRGSPTTINLDPPPTRPGRRGPVRRRVKVATKRNSRVRDADNIGFSITSSCCSNRCVWFFTADEVLIARTFYSSLSQYDASKWLLHLIEMFYNPRTLTIDLRLAGFEICLTAFLLYHGISKGKWYLVRSSFLNGATDFLHGNTSTTRATPQTDAITDWINVLIYCQGDPSPCSDEIYLPMSVVTVCYVRGIHRGLYTRSWDVGRRCSVQFPV